jgi:hypothetical protein
VSGVIRIEPEGSLKESRCATCGGKNRLRHGCVHEDECAHGVYFLEWWNGAHPRRAAFLTIGLGAFGEDSDGDDGLSFCLQWHAAGMGLTDQPARDNLGVLGRFLPREEALGVPNLEHLWQTADHIIRDDPCAAQVHEWIEGA